MTEASWKSRTFRKMVLGSTALLFLALGGLWLADPDAFPPMAPFTTAEEPDSSEAADAGTASTTPAEAVARLQRSVEAQRKYLEDLNAQLHDPKSEFKRAEKRFQQVDDERESARAAITELKAAGKAAEAAVREAALKEIDVRWQQSRERFDLALKERKAIEQSKAATQRQLQLDEQALARVSGDSSDDPPSASTAKQPDKDSGSSAPSATTATKPSPSAPAAPSKPSAPVSPLTLAASATGAAPASASSSPATPPSDRVSREVERARQVAKAKEEDAKKAENKAKNITERMEELNKNIVLAKKLLETTRERADNEQKTKAELEGELRQKRAAKAPEAELHELTARIDASQRRFQQALGEVRSATDHLHELQTELSHVQAAQIRALRDAEAKKHDAEEAEERITYLQNPFRPRNMVHWLLHHGPRLLLIAAGMFLFYRLSCVFSRRIMQLMAQGTSKRGTHQDRENRAQTLAGVFNSALSMLVLGGGSLMILDEVGIPIVPLMGGAAVIGLAVAFGAQNLIKDYFSGFMVLLEDQYGINDVVTIGSISGLVEHISLRTTVLRDLEGIVHFIPHGTITTVSNQTHGWSRALFNVDIDYKENVDQVMQVLLELGRELRRDPVFGELILDDPEMLGVDQFSDSSVVIKFFVKTRPLQQWTVKREMLRRIKKRFDELGIEIPYPHQTVHHRYDSPPPVGMPESPEAPYRRRVA
ncbi:MAG TPA: mechanosensitive ion channel domain-containing protein [Gemmataceae bacterium]|nr:mechanosensitive ion channel domain-containing protein [Gemmataceae bacterium]